MCDEMQSLDTRVDDYIRRLSLIEKLGALSNEANPMPSVGSTQGYQWCNEALHASTLIQLHAQLHSPALPQGVFVDCQTFGNKSACPTSFPQVISTAASWNTSLFKAIGTAIGREARAFHNLHANGNGGYEEGLTVWAPNINIFRSVSLPCPGDSCLRLSVACFAATMGPGP